MVTSMKEKTCAVCNAKIAQDLAPAILTMGAYGHPRYLCPHCEELIDTATKGCDFDQIVAAMDALSAAMSSYNTDDLAVIETMESIMTPAAERAKAIREGTYDFANDETEEATDDEIPEELIETEEEKAEEEREAAEEKEREKKDRIINMVVGILFGAAVLALLLTKFVFRLW